MSKEFDILSAALDEAILDAKSGNKILNSETVSIEIEPLVEYSADTIKDIRKRTGLTQALFAKWIGGFTRTVEAWESGRNKPSGPSSRLLSLLQQNKLSIAY